MKLVFTLVLGWVALGWMQGAYGFASEQQWDQFVESYIVDVKSKLGAKAIPGAALSIVNLEHPPVIRGFGKTKLKNGRPVDEHTRFRLASVSKTFAGSLSAKLASEGYFSLDEPVQKYLPALTVMKNADDLSILHLLSHSSGLVPNAYDNLIESRMSYPDIIEKLVDVEPICHPGRCYGYQNVMFSLIGDVIENSTGRSYESWMRESIFKPLKMHDASLGFDTMVTDDNYALPHVRGRKRWFTAQLKKNYYKVLPAAGVNASAADMAEWLKAQLGLYPSVLNFEALSTQVRPYTHTKKEMRRRVWRKHLQQAHYGLGWRVYDYADELIYYHSGWVQGYRTDIVIIPRLSVGFSLLLNAETGLINELTTNFIDKLLTLES